MQIPFTADEFLAVFERYNTAIWPLQVVAYLLGVAGVALALRPRPRADRAVAAVLALFWLWTGTAYHLGFFRAINGAATVFGGLFILQALLWLWFGVWRRRLSFRAGGGPLAWLGGLFVVYAMVVYPVLGALLGHGYPRSPTFGVTPCPTTIFTFGLLLWTTSAVPKPLLVIPCIWGAIGITAALSLGIWEDAGLPIAAAVGSALLLWRDGHAPGSGELGQRYA